VGDRASLTPKNLNKSSNIHKTQKREKAKQEEVRMLKKGSSNDRMMAGKTYSTFVDNLSHSNQPQPEVVDRQSATAKAGAAVDAVKPGDGVIKRVLTRQRGQISGSVCPCQAFSP
jgi:hypothetical protein